MSYQYQPHVVINRSGKNLQLMVTYRYLNKRKKKVKEIIEKKCEKKRTQKKVTMMRRA